MTTNTTTKISSSPNIRHAISLNFRDLPLVPWTTQLVGFGCWFILDIRKKCRTKIDFNNPPKKPKFTENQIHTIQNILDRTKWRLGPSIICTFTARERFHQKLI